MSIIQWIGDLFEGVRVPRFHNSYGVPNTPMSPAEPDVARMDEFDDSPAIVAPEHPGESGSEANSADGSRKAD